MPFFHYAVIHSVITVCVHSSSIYHLQTYIHESLSFPHPSEQVSWDAVLQGVVFNATHFESRITHLLYTAINTTEHGQVSHCLGFTKSFTSSIQLLGDVLHDNQGIAAISQ